MLELHGSVVVVTKEGFFTPPRVLRTEIIPLANGMDKNVTMSSCCNGMTGSQNAWTWKQVPFKGDELQLICGNKSQDTAEAALSTSFKWSEEKLECSD